MEGKIHIYTGDGKGKTTAAMGLAVRAAGSGMKVYIAQLLKDGSSSELNILRKIENITCHSCEKNFGFIKYMNQETLKEAKEYYRKYFREVIDEAKSVDLLVLDEFMAAYQYDMIDREEALYFLKNKPKNLEIVLTGRNVPSEIAHLADYLTDCKMVKHPYTQGLPARKGIEL